MYNLSEPEQLEKRLEEIKCGLLDFETGIVCDSTFTTKKALQDHQRMHNPSL